MIRLSPVLLLVAACAPSPVMPIDAVAHWYPGKSERPLVHIAISPVEGQPSTYVAVYDWERQWWGTFGCFGIVDGTVAWEASGHHDEQSILSARGFVRPDFPTPLIEVMGITHMGNGTLYLYALEGRQLRRLLQTRAVDSHWGGDGLVFRDIALTVKYGDANGDGRMDVSLTGTIERLPEMEDPPASSWPCAKVFVQDASGAFVEDTSRRLGFDNCTYDW